jgi:hypothetical protein
VPTRARRVTEARGRVSGGVPESRHRFLRPILLTDIAARARGDRHADEHEWTRAAAQQWAHTRRLPELAREFAARGDGVAVEVAGRRFQGVIVAVGDDRLDLGTASGVVHVRLALGDAHSAPGAPIVLWRASPARAGGVRVPAALVNFRARLLELEAMALPVRLGTTAFPGEISGVITVGWDHVVVHAATETVLPACWIGYVALDGYDACS